MNKINTAIILAGGKGDRISDLFPKLPKVLIEIHGKTLLERQIESLQNAGINEIIISICHLADEVDSYVKTLKIPGLDIFTIRERAALGTGGAIKNILLTTNIEQALVINGDTLSNFSFKDFINNHLENNLENSIGLVHKDSNKDFGGVKIEENSVSEFSEKGLDSFPYTNTGSYILCQDAFNHTHKDKFSLEKEILPLMKHGELSSYVFQGKFWDIGTKERYELALKEIK